MEFDFWKERRIEMTVVTNHGKKRMRERVGLPKKAVLSGADRALKNGLDRTELSGSLRRYVDSLYWQTEIKGKNLKIYGNMIYIFDRMVLITTFAIPRKYLKTVEAIKEKKKREEK